MTQNTNILIIDGSIHGDSGNTSALLNIAQTKLSSSAITSRVVLSQGVKRDEVVQHLRRADGYVFGTGTYWDSWGSPLQRFLEDMTATEGSDLWLGKPAAVVVTMHSVGGKEVLSRLQGVLNTYGTMSPPMSGIVYSAVNQLALKQGDSKIAEDLWRPDDLEIVCHNLLQAIKGTCDWQSWPLDRQGFDQLWYER